jgi:nucleoside-diphosphate-sugar epimerase
VIVVTGGLGYVGGFLLERLVQGKERVCCLVRPGKSELALSALRGMGVDIVEGDLAQTGPYTHALATARVIVHLAHIRYAPQVLQHVGPENERIVLVSSLWRFSRVASPVVGEIIEAEKAVEQSDKPWVLLRPSMIYGPRGDRNISRLTTHLQRWRFLPIFGNGQNLHQPVYVGDVVSAILASVERPGIEYRSYALAGRYPLSYRELVYAVGGSVGISPWIVALPAGPVAYLLQMLRRCGLSIGIEPEQIMRLQEDKSYSIKDAQQDLGFEPLEFAQGLQSIRGMEN